ncbi:MAG: Uncharacterised protein [Arcobacter lacus]|nr:MAG: Uncharacterised protein [Arcobacter lacus]
MKSKEGISFNINENCWSFDIKLENEYMPSTTTSSTTTEVTDQSIIYFELQLKPLGGIKQTYNKN